MMRRRLGTLLALVGVLLLADVALTLVWREPITWLEARRDQSRLEHRYEKLADSVDATAARAADPGADGAQLQRPAMRNAALRLQRRVGDGDPIGRIEIPTIGLRMVVVQGTTTDDLKQGPGHYTRTRLPGEPGTVAIAGHRTTYLQPFRRIDELKPGQRIDVTMPYGRFTYTVTGHRIVRPEAVHVLNSRQGQDRIVLTACHPLFSASKRIVVFGRLTAVGRA